MNRRTRPLVPRRGADAPAGVDEATAGARAAGDGRARASTRHTGSVALRTGPDETPPAGVAPAGRLGSGGVLVLALLVTAVVAAWHLTQGTSQIGAGDLWQLVTGDGDRATRNILVASRLPRMLAGLTVGVALGTSGALLQSLARNALASPDTLGVTAGAAFAVTLCAALGISLPLLGGGLVAFAGGLLTAVLVLALASGTGSTTRLILAGSATALALASGTSMLLILFEQETTGLFAWGNGVLTQINLDGVRQLGPIVLLAVAVSMALASRMDLLALGDDTAQVLGVRVRRTRAYATLLAVLLAAASVALCGPIGFVGLCAPAIVRLASGWVRPLRRHLLLLPVSGLAGAVIVLLADILLRAAIGAGDGLQVPTGVITTVLGAIVLVVLARRSRDAGPTRNPPGARPGRAQSGRRLVVVLVVSGVVLVAAMIVGLLAGYTWLLLGDVGNWVRGLAVPSIDFALDERTPRVLAAVLCGAALALAGTVVQAVCRNPLAEPGILGITAGAGVGAVSLLALTPVAGVWAMTGVAGVGALVAFALVYGLAWRHGLDSDRLVLVGVGVSAGATAVTTLIIVSSNPWNTPLALTWLSGTTYGRTFGQLLPVTIALLVVLPVVAWLHRHLDLLALDDDTPRLVGVRLETLRLVTLGAAALLAATAVSAIGVVGFVGLVAPHAARALVGSRHARVIPVAILLGAALVSVADTLGRTVIAPAQVPAGLIVALVGAPYFVYLLWRSRA